MTKPDLLQHFSARGSRYDQLRSDPSARQLRTVAAVGDLSQRRVLDVGCGTGRVARALADDHGAIICGVEPSDLRLVAQTRVGGGFVEVVAGRAEDLPYPDQSFERVLLHMVIHLIDRPRSLREGRRVLRPAGRLVSCSMNPGRVETLWLSRLFPSYAAMDAGRFPTGEQIEATMAAAGFEAIRIHPFAESTTFSRAIALERLAAKHTSTLSLLDPAEFDAGLARAASDLPEVVESEAHLLIATGVRP